MAPKTVDRKLVTHLLPKSIGAEAYRSLRTNLQYAALDEPLQTLMVTSAAPGEGKSLTSANLAVAFAQAGQQVLLVDADLRNPFLARLFAISGRWAGLTAVVAGNMEIEEAVQPGPVEGLSVMPSGPIPPNPAELIGSQRMMALLEELRHRYDLVIIDTPPILAVTDACVLAPRLDGVVLVVRANKVGHPQVRRAKEALVAVRARLLGVVLDAVEPQDGDGYGYYYYYGRG